MSDSLIKVRPLQDRVIVKVLEEGEKLTDGGLVVPDVAKEKPQQGVVLGVGKGHVDPFTGAVVPVDVENGDTVLFGKYSGTEIEIDNEKYLILKEDELLGAFTV